MRLAQVSCGIVAGFLFFTFSTKTIPAILCLTFSFHTPSFPPLLFLLLLLLPAVLPSFIFHIISCNLSLWKFQQIVPFIIFVKKKVKNHIPVEWFISKLPVFILCHSIKWIPNIYELIQVEYDEVSFPFTPWIDLRNHNGDPWKYYVNVSVNKCRWIACDLYFWCLGQRLSVSGHVIIL